jgi:phage-related protein
MKPVVFLGDSLDSLRAFSESARHNAGFQLERVQRGLEPDDWKSMSTVGAGVREIRIREASGAFQIIYLANRPEAVFVLHAFQKKTQRTSRRDLAAAQQRFKELKRGA